jgi:hypothetical protein
MFNKKCTVKKKMLSVTGRNRTSSDRDGCFSEEDQQICAHTAVHLNSLVQEKSYHILRDG